MVMETVAQPVSSRLRFSNFTAVGIVVVAEPWREEFTITAEIDDLRGCRNWSYGEIAPCLSIWTGFGNPVAPNCIAKIGRNRLLNPMQSLYGVGQPNRSGS